MDTTSVYVRMQSGLYWKKLQYRSGANQPTDENNLTIGQVPFRHQMGSSSNRYNFSIGPVTNRHLIVTTLLWVRLQLHI